MSKKQLTFAERRERLEAIASDVEVIATDLARYATALASYRDTFRVSAPGIPANL